LFAKAILKSGTLDCQLLFT